MGLNKRGRGLHSRYAGISLLQFLLGFLFFINPFGRQFSWLKFSSLCLPFLISFWWIVAWCIALLLLHSASVLFGLRPAGLLPFHGYAMNRGGVLP